MCDTISVDLTVSALVLASGARNALQFARAIHLPHENAWKYIRGSVPWRPRPRTARRMAVAAGCSVSEVYSAVDETRRRYLAEKARDSALSEANSSKRREKRNRGTLDLNPPLE